MIRNLKKYQKRVTSHREILPENTSGGEPSSQRYLKKKPPFLRRKQPKPKKENPTKDQQTAQKGVSEEDAQRFGVAIEPVERKENRAP